MMLPDAERTVPKVLTLDAKTATVEEVVRCLRVTGGVIVKDYLAPELLDKMYVEIKPHLADIPDQEPEKPAQKTNGGLAADGVFQEDFFPHKSRRAFGMIAKSPTSIEVLLHPLYQGVIKAFLQSHFTNMYGVSNSVSVVSEPKVNNSIVFSIMPGAKAQPLHRDDGPHHIMNERVEVYPEDLTKTHRDSCIGVFVAGSRTTKENGATRFIPGSHLWAHESPPVEDLAVQAELEKGDAFIMLGNCYHAGSANVSKSSERIIFSSFYCRGFLAAEENQSLAIPIEIAAKFPVELQQAVGYGLSAPVVGYVDGQDPALLLKKYQKSISPVAATVMPGYERIADALGISSATTITLPGGGKMISCSGMVGSGADGSVLPDIETQTRAACEGVGKAIMHAGGFLSSQAAWRSVYEINTFHTNMPDAPLVLKIIREMTGEHKPACTSVGVAALWTPAYQIEIQVRAFAA